jgi:serine/threonine protein kinase
MYRFGKTLGAGTYGIVREAVGAGEKKVAIKIILKKNVKGNEQMVYDELRMLQEMKHPHIVRFEDWFESKVSRCVPLKSNLTNDAVGQVLHSNAIGNGRRIVRQNL